MLKCAALAVLLLWPSLAPAAELDGVTMPSTWELNGARLVLNGMALRTYSMLRVHIYVAGLYLPQPTSDPQAIIDSNGPKLLRFVFSRAVGASAARKSWEEAFAANCRAPCRLPAADVSQFLAHVPPVKRGDVSMLAFINHSLYVTMNGQTLGRVQDPALVSVILRSFIGAHPTSPGVKRGLLGQGS